MQYEITYDGKSYAIEGPEGATEDDLWDVFTHRQGRIEAEKVEEPSYLDAVGERALALAKPVVSGAEALMSVGSGIAAEPAAGLVGIGGAIGEATGMLPEGAGAGSIEAVRENLTYQPRSEGGQEAMSAVGDVVEGIGNQVTKASRAMGLDEEIVKPALLGALTLSPFIPKGVSKIGGKQPKLVRDQLEQSSHKRPVERLTEIEELPPEPPGTTAWQYWSRDPDGAPMPIANLAAESFAIDAAVATAAQGERLGRNPTGLTTSPDIISLRASPALHGRMRQMEADGIRKASEFDDVFVNEMRGGIQKLRTMDPETHRQFKKAWLNQDRIGAEAAYSKAVGGATARKHFSLMDKAFKKRDAELTEVFPTYRGLPNYLPRQVKNPEKLAQQFGPDLQSKLAKLRHEYDSGKIDRMEFANGLNTLMTQGAKQVAAGKATSHAKHRKKSSVDDIELDAYLDPEDILPEYIRTTGQSIAEKRFLGKHKSVVDSIGDILSKHPEISDPMKIRVRDMLMSRFAPNVHSEMRPWVQKAKDLGYLGTIADAASAVTQIGDAAVSFARQGAFNSLRAIGSSAMPKALRKRKGVVEPEDVGVKDIMHETAQAHGKTSKSLDKLLQLSGFKTVDKYGKRVILNSALNRLKRQARNPRNKRLKKDYGWMGAARYRQFVDDLKTGDVKNKNVQFALVNELMDVQPISLSQMPLKYLTNPNGRIFYALKTWAIRQINRYREDAIRGDYGRLAGHAMSVYLASMGVDLAKLFMERAIKGDPIEEEDINHEAANNLLAMGFGSTYQVSKIARGEGVSSMIGQMATPVLLDFIFRDVYRALRFGDWQPIVSRVPVIGRSIAGAMEDED